MCVSASRFRRRDIVQIENALDLEGDVALVFDEGQVSAGIGDLREFDEFTGFNFHQRGRIGAARNRIARQFAAAARLKAPAVRIRATRATSSSSISGKEGKLRTSRQHASVTGSAQSRTPCRGRIPGGGPGSGNARPWRFPARPMLSGSDRAPACG